MGGVGKKLVHGWGINDAGYSVNLVVDGKQVMCPFYKVWKDMLRRCYSESFQIQNPAYLGCSVSPDWKYFSSFKSWMEQQNWEGRQLDKDIILHGNKVYGPEVCIFVTRAVNIFFTCEKKKTTNPIGSFTNKLGNYVVSIGGNSKRIHLGVYKTAQEAIGAWSEAKINLAIELERSYPELAGLLVAKVKQITINELNKEV